MDNPKTELDMLDIGCGLGGWSIGFHREGYDCTGLDKVDVGYPYRLILADMRNWHSDRYYYVVVASPPCTEFSPLTKLSHAKGQRGPPDPEGPEGMGLVRETKRIIDEIKPKYWLLENVYGSIPYISKELGPPRVIAKPWVLWGTFPDFIADLPKGGDRKMSHSFEKRNKGGNKIGLPEDFPFDPLRSWKRARIPVFLAQKLAQVMKE